MLSKIGEEAGEHKRGYRGRNPKGGGELKKTYSTVVGEGEFQKGRRGKNNRGEIKRVVKQAALDEG